MRARWRALPLAAALVLGLAACQQAADENEPVASPRTAVAPSSDPNRADGFKLGVANYSTATPHLAALNQAMVERAEELGIEVVGKDAGGDPEQLTADVADLLAAGVDGVIVSGGDLVNAPGVSLAMKDSPVSLVYVDRLFDSGAYTASIGASHSGIGWDSCEFIGGALGGRGKVATIKGGPQTNPIGLELSEGFESCLKDSYPDMTLVSPKAFGDWTAAGGEAAMAELLQTHPDIVAVFCQNDAMCLGAQTAAAAKGRSHELVLVGVGGSPEAIQAIQAGTNFIATSLIDPREIGTQGVNLMATIFKREDFARNSFVPSPLVRKENAAEYLDPNAG